MKQEAAQTCHKVNPHNMLLDLSLLTQCRRAVLKNQGRADVRPGKCAACSLGEAIKGSKGASIRAPGPGQTLGFSDRLFAYFCCRKLNQVQEVGDSANGLENEELDGVKCSRGMSGTESLFPELSSAGRCEIVQSRRSLPRGLSANCRARRGKSLGGPCVLLRASDRRGYNKHQFQKHFAGLGTWPVTEAERVGQI